MSIAEGGSVSLSNVLASIFAILLMLAMWRSPLSEKAVARFAARMRRTSFSLSIYRWLIFYWDGRDHLGAKIIGFEEPKFWADNNVQSEFTLHNLAFYHNHLLHRSFLLAGFLGSFCWISLRYWQKRQKRSSSVDPSYLLPDWPVSSFFYPTMVFYFAIDYTDFRNRVDFLHPADQEHCEFIMGLGILLFFLINFFRQGKEVDSTRQRLI